MKQTKRTLKNMMNSKSVKTLKNGAATNCEGGNNLGCCQYPPVYYSFYYNGYYYYYY